jgi:hypothetical protein
MSAAIGCFLGICNVVFIAIGLEWRDPSLPAHCVITIGMVPGIVTGTFVGCIASVTERCPIWLRRTLLAIPALGVVGGLAHAFELERHFLVAAIPTLVAVMILEHHTRVVDPLPVAAVER